MIQDISPHRFSNDYISERNMHEDDLIIHFKENTFLLKENGDELEFPKKKDLPEITDNTNNHFLFTLNDKPCFLVWDSLSIDKPGLVYKEIDFFRNTAQKEIAWISMVSFHLRNWYAENKFCGKCGGKTQ